MAQSLSSETDICNMALDHLGEEIIMSSGVDNRPAVKFVRRWYAHTRDTLLETAYWRFARKRASLASTATPAFEWGYSYPLPTDFLKLIPMTADGYMNGAVMSHDIENGCILTNTAGPLLIRYIARITDPGKFSNLFTEALALNLALRATLKITGKQGYREQLAKDFERALMNAQIADGMMGDQQAPLDSDWETLGRYGGP